MIDAESYGDLLVDSQPPMHSRLVAKGEMMKLGVMMMREEEQEYELWEPARSLDLGGCQKKHWNWLPGSSSSFS